MPFLADAKMIGIIRHSYFTGEERKIHEEGGKKQDDRHNLLNRCLSKKKKKGKKSWHNFNDWLKNVIADAGMTKIYRTESVINSHQRAMSAISCYQFHLVETN